MSLSKINSRINLDYLKNEKENLYFDRKRAKISLQDLANEIASFANSNGGIIVVGITDDGKIEGFNIYGADKLNECQKVVTNYLKNTPTYRMELLDIQNEKGEMDKLLLFHIEPELNYIIRNNKDEVYCRQGDSSIKLNANQIRSLEYDRKERDFETEVLLESSINDIDTEVMEVYKRKIDTDLPNEEILKARGFLREKNGKYHLTKAGMLLFGKNPSIYLPSARVRVLKFEGTEFQVGTEMNIIKDRTFDKCLYKILEQAREFINSQLREFTHLSPDGVFETVPEYPEFAWYEGLVNAVCHRDYSNSGEYIIVKLFDDRLEISSPGRLGGFVTLETMKNKRYSRNPQIARVLNELGLVRELNEGVKRIYSEMQRFYLKDPVYSEPDRNSVLLVLDNNIAVRANRKQETLKKSDAIKDKWDILNYAERQVLQVINDKGEVTSDDVSKIINRGKTTAVKLLNKLIDLDLIVWTGTSKKDSYGRYKMK
jgi:ATP-dependent DNA helicase RecG